MSLIMGAVRRITIALLSAALVLATAGGAAARPGKPLIQGRHDVLRAGMYATVIDSHNRIQILNRLCPSPGKGAGCEPVLQALRTALGAAVDVPIRWVQKERKDGGRFYAFSAVERNGSHARFDYAWDDPGFLGCNARGDVEFRRIDWTGWRVSGGQGLIGCAVAGSKR
jgi:hypothetical protein